MSLISLIFLKKGLSVVSQFVDSKLPTLDVKVWWSGEQLQFEFFEKETVSNRVIQRGTALAESSVRPSLNQEVVRRLLQTSASLPITAKQSALSAFAQKLRNLGFSVESSRLILVHGVTRYLEMVGKSNLAPSHEQFKPQYYDKYYRKLERRLQKYEQKAGWYRSDKPANLRRSYLPREWKGAKPIIKKKLPGIEYSTILQVPCTKGSRLLKELAKLEPRLTKLTGYHSMLVER